MHDLSAIIKRPADDGSIDERKSLSHRACKVLTIINAQGCLNQQALADKLSIRPQSVSEVVSKLEINGYIEKSESTNNKRENIICLTAKGKKEAEIADERIENHANKLLIALSDEEIETMTALYEKIIKSKTD
jgi:DNA-binding MarR family transcriptional regulator